MSAMFFILIVNFYWLHFSGDTNIEIEPGICSWIRLVYAPLCPPSDLFPSFPCMFRNTIHPGPLSMMDTSGSASLAI